MNLDVVSALNELEKERGIAKEIILEAIEAAITSAYKRNYGTSQNVRVEIDSKTGNIGVYARKAVVEEVTDEASEISLSEAKETDPNYVLDDIVEIEVTPSDFGRIAAQTAKQVVIQRIREAERALVYDEFSSREGEVITGIVQRSDHRNVIIDLGKAEAILGPSDQMPGEFHSQGARLKVYVSEVRQTNKGPQIYVSRTHPGLVSRLFEMEVPEIHDGIVEIRAVAREAGARSKLAVSSRDENVDPVGACVGPRGSRVQAVVNELRGEKIDVIPWSALPEDFVGNALSPAKVIRVYLDEDSKTARAVVPDNHLSLAIGKEGQNARLAARLTGWRIDIKSQEQMAQILAREAFERATPEESESEEEVPLEEELSVEEEPVLSVESPEEMEPTPTDDSQDEVAAGDRASKGLEDDALAQPLADGKSVTEDELGDAPLAETVAEAVVEREETDGEEEIEKIEQLPQEEPIALDETDEDDASGAADLELSEEEIRRRREPRVAAGTPKVKSRKTRKQELESLLEEELIESEPLPTLFSGGPKKDGTARHYVIGADEGEEGLTLASRLGLDTEQKAEKKGKKQSPKKVIKDLSELGLVDFEFDE